MTLVNRIIRLLASKKRTGLDDTNIFFPVAFLMHVN